jgi:hypothetical protein
VFDSITHAQGLIHILLGILQAHAGDQPLIPGLDLRRGASYSVGNLRPARRVGPQGEFRTELVVEIVQTYRTPAAPGPAPLPFRGGATVIIDLQSWQIRYVIYKRLYLKLPDEAGGDGGTPVNRYNRQRRMVRPAVWEGEASASLARHLAATYTSPARRLQLERTGPFALLHRNY